MAGSDPIHIKPSHRGEFTEAALKHHEGVQEFARHIVGDKHASEHLKRQAQFALNAEHWHHH